MTVPLMTLLTPLAGIAMPLADFAEDYALFPAEASTFAEANDWLFVMITWVSIAFFIPIVIALFWFSYRYRKPKGERAESNVAHNTPLEVAWSVFPSFFLVGMFVIGARHYLDQRTVPEGATEVVVKSQKWSWGFDYGGGVINPELHLLVDEPARLSMRSDDVIHCLYIPAFRAKKDIVPGRYNYMWFKPTKVTPKISDEELAKINAELKAAGREWDQATYNEYQITRDGYQFFDLYCAEYCGTNHSQMQAMVVVHQTREELNAWIEQYSVRPDGTSLADYGKLLYETRGCKGCHALDNNAKAMQAPSFLNLYGSQHALVGGENVTVDSNYIRESILYPKAKIVAGFQPVMPSFKGQLSDDDINSIIAFQKSISDKTPAEEKPAVESEAEAQ